MRLVHLSDLHLGYRQYQRLTPGGINQREADVAKTFTAAIQRIISLAPDMVLVAGDVFHNVRPTNQAILHAFLQFSKLMQALPDAIVIIVAGNHDTPRSAETGGILQLFSQLGIHVVDREPQRLPFPDRDLSVLAVPDVHLGRAALTPDPSARHNVLLLHGEVEGMLPAHVAAATDRAAVAISHEEIGAARWSYVALGHYHVYREIAPNAYYAGSIDYTSANTWGELFEERIAGLPGKGLIERDLESGVHTFHPLPGSRPLVDLPPISARDLTAADLNERIRQTVDGCLGGIDEKVVRLVIRELPRHVARELDHKQLREYKRRALNFQLDIRRPEPLRLHASGAPGRRPSLADFVRDKLQARSIGTDIDKEAFVKRGLEYLREAEQSAVTPAPVMES
jgi:hypothetical protein